LAGPAISHRASEALAGPTKAVPVQIGIKPPKCPRIAPSAKKRREQINMEDVGNVTTVVLARVL